MHIFRNAPPDLCVHQSREAETPAEQYRVLRRELELYNPHYLTRPHLIALNKLDVVLQTHGAETFEQARAFL
eukprot:4683692-Pleurochrysis_carterae.AAC.1